MQASEPVTLNFVNADIDAVARTMATITGRNVVVDPRVKGQLTLSTENPVTPKVAFDQFLAALRLQGFTVVEASGLYKVVPEADAKLQTDNVAVSAGGGQGVAAGGQIVTQIFKLNFENANNLVPVLRPLISPNNTINANPGNNSLVITDYADNLRRIGRIIAAMDVAHATDVEVIPLRHAVAGELAPLVARLIEGGTPTAGAPANAQAQVDASYKTTLLAESRSNALIVRAANPARLAQVRALVAQLDQPAATIGGNASGNIHVVYLKNADAVRLATTLRAALAVDAQGQAQGGGATASLGGTTAAAGRGRALGGLSATGAAANGLGTGTSAMSSGLGSGAQAGTSAGGQQESVSTGGIIQADPATNSLIITAPEPLFRQIRAVIDKLDGRRAQVLIESLIVEVSANKVAEFGIQWQSVLGRSGTLGLLGTNSSVTGPNILSLALAAASGDPKTIAQNMPGAGFNAAVAPRINGKYYLGALANFLENTGDANVLSTPNLLTLDNEEAQIIVGENVPFPTGQFTNTGGANGSVNPFTTVDRKDVGLMLRVRPQINENGTVKLTLYQEVSNVDKSTLTNTYGPSTNKRAIESTVLVDDGSIIVLGGLLEDSYSRGEDKVPLLGDVPVVGNLFRSESRTRQKSNLMVFLRPVVIRDTATSETLVQDRYDAIRALQQASQPEPRAVLRSVSDAPVLPPLPGSGEKGEVPAPLPPSVTRPPEQPLSGNMPQPLQ